MSNCIKCGSYTPDGWNLCPSCQKAMKTELGRFIEKQTPKRIIPAKVYGLTESCPSCHSEVRSAYTYCTICGQRLDWSDS